MRFVVLYRIMLISPTSLSDKISQTTTDIFETHILWAEIRTWKPVMPVRYWWIWWWKEM